MLLFTLAMTWLAVISGLVAKTAEGAGVFACPLLFLPFVSSAFVPTAFMPGPIRIFAENQPVTSIVEAVRSLLMGQPVGNDLWISLSWCLGILIVASILAVRAYMRRAA